MKRRFGEVAPIPSRIPGRDPRYRARYTGPNGIRYKAPHTFGSRGDAEAWLKGVLKRINAGVWLPPSADGERDRIPTLGDYAETRIKARQARPVKPLRASTADTYRRSLRLECADLLPLRVDAITAQTISDWHAERAARGRPTQLANAYLLLRSIFADAVRERLVEESPCQVHGANGKPKPKHKAEALDVAEFRAYLDAVGEKRALPLMVAMMCGLRSGEVRALQVRDFDPASGRISVSRTVVRVPPAPGQPREYAFTAPKTEAGVRDVFAPEFLRAPLAEHVEGLPADRLLFVAGDGVTPLHSQVLRDAHVRGRTAIGRPTLTIHDLRKTAATWAAQGGATVRELMVMLGHTTPQMAMVYQAAAQERMRGIAGRMDGMLSGNS